MSSCSFRLASLTVRRYNIYRRLLWSLRMAAWAIERPWTRHYALRIRILFLFSSLEKHPVPSPSVADQSRTRIGINVWNLHLKWVLPELRWSSSRKLPVTCSRSVREITAEVEELSRIPLAGLQRDELFRLSCTSWTTLIKRPWDLKPFTS